MSKVYKTPDCGTHRKYIFRHLKSKVLKFQVEAKGDVNLCLSPSPNEVPYQQYEIYLGGWRGGESAIRRNKRDDVVRVPTPDVVSAGQFRSFWLVITNHSIKVGKKGEATPFLIHTDAAIAFSVSYYGFCTAHGSTGQWIFDDDVKSEIDMGSIDNAIREMHIQPSSGCSPLDPSVMYPGAVSNAPCNFYPTLPSTETAMKVYKTPDCGTHRKYIFRPLKNNIFKFRVEAKSNVNLCLSPSPNEVPYQQYEIFLGGWEGRESNIRRNKQDDVVKVPTPDILNGSQFKGFWLVITDHTIKVGTEGQAAPFLVHHDTAVKFNISYYGYCTAYGSTGKWIFGDDDIKPAIDMSSSGDIINQTHMLPSAAASNLLPPTMYPSTPTPPSYPASFAPSAPSDMEINIKWIPCKLVTMCPAPVQAAPGMYTALAHHQGGLIPGVVTLPTDHVCYIPWGGHVIPKINFYLLSNPGNLEVLWQGASGGRVPAEAVPGGYSESKEPLFVGRFKRDGNYVIGKVHPSHHVCYAPQWGKEISSAIYEVLCLKAIPSTFVVL